MNNIHYTNKKVKLKLKFIIKNTKYNESDSDVLSTLEIKILDKDYRYDPSDKSKIEFLSKYGLYINTDKRFYASKRGHFNQSELMLPSLENECEWMSFNFYNDSSRAVFLKKLYLSLKDWSNTWKGFYYDSPSAIEIEDDTWTIYTTYKSTLSSLTNKEVY
jgi:hypothetical protein